MLVVRIQLDVVLLGQMHDFCSKFCLILPRNACKSRACRLVDAAKVEVSCLSEGLALSLRSWKMPYGLILIIVPFVQVQGVLRGQDLVLPAIVEVRVRLEGLQAFTPVPTLWLLAGLEVLVADVPLSLGVLEVVVASSLVIKRALQNLLSLQGLRIYSIRHLVAAIIRQRIRTEHLIDLFLNLDARIVHRLIILVSRSRQRIGCAEKWWFRHCLRAEWILRLISARVVIVLFLEQESFRAFRNGGQAGGDLRVELLGVLERILADGHL